MREFKLTATRCTARNTPRGFFMYDHMRMSPSNQNTVFKPDSFLSTSKDQAYNNVH